MRAPSVVPPLIIFICCALLLFWNLDAKYLWQDEAATAVLGERFLSYGRPLGYDGKNLITMDFYRAQEESKLRTDDPADAVRYFSGRHEFKEDTTWTAHPWGPFAVAGISLFLLGKNTLAARLPFALAGAILVALLFAIVRRHLSSPLPAFVAAALLMGNTFWFLHMRQCRYYALSALFLLLTFECYLRWQEGKRWGAPAFVGAAWLWFQQDFGSLWPVLMVLGVDSVLMNLRDRKRLLNAVLVFTVAAITIAPFVFYYEMFESRLGGAFIAWPYNIWTILFQMNQFQLAFVLIPLVILFLWRERLERQDSRGRHFVILSLNIIWASALWMSSMVPYPFVRYLIPVTSLCAIVSAYGIVTIARSVAHTRTASWPTIAAATAMVMLCLVTNLPSYPGGWIVPERYIMALYTSSVVRPELKVYMDNLRGREPDPNRATVEFLKRRLSPDDEVVCNYEDVPLMFYLQNPIRGGYPVSGLQTAGGYRNMP